MTPLEEIAPIADVRVDISVELDRKTMSIRDLLELESGTVIEMNRSAGDNIDIYVGGARIGSGEIVIIESTMGVRITDFETGD